jgi:hypothetical protein
MAQDRFITVYSTTSPQDSGLFEYLLPIFQAATGLKVDVAAVGTGEALALGRRGYADALFVHDRPAEDKFVADGYGVDRRDVSLSLTKARHRSISAAWTASASFIEVRPISVNCRITRLTRETCDDDVC